MLSKIDEYCCILEKELKLNKSFVGYCIADTKIINAIGIYGFRTLKDAGLLEKSNLKGCRQYYYYTCKRPLIIDRRWRYE